MWHKLQKPDMDPNSAFTVPDASGVPVFSYPNKVIDNIRYMLARIQRDHPEHAPLPRRLAMVSALRGEGVTYLCHALGATAANDFPVQVCMVELNWHWPYRSPLVNPENPGMAGVLNGWAKVEDALVPTGWPNLFVLPAGRFEPNQLPVLARSEQLRKLLNQLNERFDHLILDIPAILSTSDSVPLAGLANGICLVIRHGVTMETDVRAALDEIRHLPVIGTVLNQSEYATPSALVDLLVGRD